MTSQKAQNMSDSLDQIWEQKDHNLTSTAE